MPQLKPTRGICLNRNHPLSRGLVGLWLFNEGSGGQVFDLSGNRNTISFAAGAASPSWGSGQFGPVLSFDGGDYAFAPDNPSLNPSNQLTIVVWVKQTNIGTTEVWVGKEGSSTNRSYYLRCYTAGPNVNTIQLVLSSDGTTFNTWQSGNSIMTAGVWNQIVAVYNSSESEPRLYFNGKHIPGSWAAGSMPASLFNNSAQLELGTRRNGDEFFTGLLDIPLIYNRALSASEVALLHREPFCMFERVNRPELIGGQIVNLAGSSVALSSLSATAKVMRKVGGNVVGTSDVAALLNSIRSLLEVERDWLREALFNGMTANAFKLGTTLSLGWFWVRVAGCSVLYRGSSMGEIDFVNI